MSKVHTLSSVIGRYASAKDIDATRAGKAVRSHLRTCAARDDAKGEAVRAIMQRSNKTAPNDGNRWQGLTDNEVKVLFPTL